MNKKLMSKEMAAAAYAILAEECGAGAFGEAPFVCEFSVESPYGPTSEWRFQGSLGYGGKFYYPDMRVACYPEDETPDRLASIEKANTRLSDLKKAMESE